MNPHDTANPKDRLGACKPQLHLFPPAALILGAKAMEHGADKYGPYNWRVKNVRATVYISAAMRHLQQYLDGETADVDSGLPHEAHVIACMAIVLDAKFGGNLIDDRPVPGPAAKMITAFTKPAPPLTLQELFEPLEPPTCAETPS